MDMLGILCQSVMNQRKVTTRNSDMIKLQHCCTGSDARLMDLTGGFVLHEKYYKQFVAKEARILESIL